MCDLYNVLAIFYGGNLHGESAVQYYSSMIERKKDKLHVY